MFEKKIKAIVGDISKNAQTKFQCRISVETTVEEIGLIQAGTLIAAENIFHHARNPRYCILQVISSFPEKQTRRSTGKIQLSCQGAPLGIELHIEKPRSKAPVVEVRAADTVPLYEAEAFVLDSEMTRTVLHHLAPESRSKGNGSRIDIGTCAPNPEVNVGVDAMSLIRGNAAIISAKPRARTSITNTLIHALLTGTEQLVHIVYCDVNYTGTLSLAHEFGDNEHAMLLGLNDRFLPSSVFSALRNPSDRQMFKRAVFDYLDMMILPSIMESRRRDFTYPIANAMRKNRVSVYRPHEPTVNEFINEIRVDLVDGLDEDGVTIVTELMNGISNHFQGERFNDRNVSDIVDMIDETSHDVKSPSIRRALLDLRNEIQTQFESISKDIPASARVTVEDMVKRLNSEHHSSLTIAQGQRGTDILRFVSTILQRLTEERLRHLKTRTPVLFIFNNADEYLTRNGGGAYREAGTERFVDILNTILTAGRRHGIGFVLTLENSASLDLFLARKIQAYFIGPIRFVDDLQQIEKLLNVSQDLIQDAVTFEDGFCLYTNSMSPYQRRVPLPVTFPTNIQTLHDFLDAFLAKQEQLRQEREREERERKLREEHIRQQEKKQRRTSSSRRRREPETSTESEPDASAQHDEETQTPTVRRATSGSRSRRSSRSRTSEQSSFSTTSSDESPDQDNQQQEERTTSTTKSRGSRSGRRTRSRRPATSSEPTGQERQETGAETVTTRSVEEEPEPAPTASESEKSTSRSRRSSRSGQRRSSSARSRKKPADSSKNPEQDKPLSPTETATDDSTSGKSEPPTAASESTGTEETTSTTRRPSRPRQRRSSSRSRKKPADSSEE